MVYARDQSEACGSDSNESCRSWTELRLIDAESGREISRLAGQKASGSGSGLSAPLAVDFTSDGNVVVQQEYSRESLESGIQLGCSQLPVGDVAGAPHQVLGNLPPATYRPHPPRTETQS